MIYYFLKKLTFVEGKILEVLWGGNIAAFTKKR